MLPADAGKGLAAALAVSAAHNENIRFAFSKSVPPHPAKGCGKRQPAWTNRRANFVLCGFAVAKTAKKIAIPKLPEIAF